MKRSSRTRLGAPLGAALLVAAIATAGAHAVGTSTAAKAPPALLAQIPSPAAERPFQARGTYVGQAGKGRGSPYVALVIQGSKVAIYVCDGRTLGDWFGGTITDGRITARSANGTTVDATLAGGRVTGTVKLRDRPARPFTALRRRGRRSACSGLRLRRATCSGRSSCPLVSAASSEPGKADRLDRLE